MSNSFLKMSLRFRLLYPLVALLLIGLVSSGNSVASENEAAINETPITADDRQHWSFTPVVRPDLPKVPDNANIRNAIDQFVVARLQQQKRTPLREANRQMLIRRLTFDLWGLPPTPDQVDRFTGDHAPDAYGRLVDRLLASHHFGERWAQHWLDLARFAETDGFEHDLLRPQAWRYRDWVIDALNADMPYDQFVALQLAGDELQPNDPAASVATAFCLSGPDMPDINSQQERRHNLLNEMTSTVGSVFLGLQIGCAQCHDHKYDPLSQADFYRLRAVFQRAVHVKRNKSVDLLSESLTSAEASYLMIRGDYRRQGPEVDPGVPRIANPQGYRIEPQAKNKKTSGRRASLARWITQPENPLTARVIVNRLWQHHFGHGLSLSPSDFGIMGDEPSHPLLLDYLATELVRSDWSLKQMHRLMVCSAAYRRASRVDMDDPAAALFRDNQASDPHNLSLWRANRRRIEGEAVRDAMLASAGMLNTRRGGPGVMPPLPSEVTKTLLRGQWKVSSDLADHTRRGIYLFARRNLRFPIFDAFDRPDADTSCAIRNRSTTAPQSLLMLNSRLSLDCARRLAGRVGQQTSGTGAQIVAAYRYTLARAPAPDELATARAFVGGQIELFRREQRKLQTLAMPIPMLGRDDPLASAALVDLCLVLYNLNEFVYVD